MSKDADAQPAQPRVRRTQAERSAAMRERLLDAAIDCLHDLGYSRTTTIEVAARAGVSRGAQLHHFPTKEHLVAVAVRHVFDRRIKEFRDAFAALPEGVDKQSAAVGILWEMMTSRTFYAWLELVVAARTDARLRATVSAIEKEFFEQAHATALDFFSPAEDNPESARTIPLFTLTVLQGLAVGRIAWGEDDPRIATLLLRLKAIAALAVSPKPVSSVDVAGTRARG